MGIQSKMGIAVFLAVLFCAGTLFAQNVKIGYVDLEKAFNEYYRTQEENAKLQELQKVKKAEADKMVSEVNKLKEEADLLSDEAKKSKEAVVQEKIKELRDYERDTVQEIRDKLLSLRKEILDSITKVIEEKGKREGYTFIFVSDVMIYKEAGLDMTEDLIKILNKGHESAAAPVASATPAAAPAAKKK